METQYKTCSGRLCKSNKSHPEIEFKDDKGIVRKTCTKCRNSEKERKKGKGITEAQKRYKQSEKGKETNHKYNTSEKGKEISRQTSSAYREKNREQLNAERRKQNDSDSDD